MVTYFPLVGIVGARDGLSVGVRRRELNKLSNTLISKLEGLGSLFSKNDNGNIRTKLVPEDCVTGDCPVVVLARMAVAKNPELLVDNRKALRRASSLLSQEITAAPEGWRNLDALVLGTVLLQADPQEVLEVIEAADYERSPFRAELVEALGL